MNFFYLFNEPSHPGPLTRILELKAQVNYFMKANFLCGSINRFIQYGNEKWEWTEWGLVVRSKGRIWTLPVRLPGNKSHVSVQCIVKSGCAMANAVFINLNQFRAVVRDPDESRWNDKIMNASQNNEKTIVWRRGGFSRASMSLVALQQLQQVNPVKKPLKMFHRWSTGSKK